MYKVTCWNGKEIVNVLIADFYDFNIVLAYLGYTPDEDHFIKIKFIPNNRSSEDNFEE